MDDVLLFIVNFTYHGVGDQIWEVWRNQTIWFPIPDCPVFVVLEQSQGRS
jgi:hypothetical protein